MTHPFKHCAACSEPMECGSWASCSQRQPTAATVSPLELMIALHYHTTPTLYSEHNSQHAYSPAVIGIKEDFIARGYLIPARPEWQEKYGLDFEATDALRVWADAICRVPRPEHVWVIPK